MKVSVHIPTAEGSVFAEVKRVWEFRLYVETVGHNRGKLAIHGSVASFPYILVRKLLRVDEIQDSLNLCSIAAFLRGDVYWRMSYCSILGCWVFEVSRLHWGIALLEYVQEYL